MIYLARTCTRLRYIDLAYCPILTDAAVREIGLNLPKLRRIGLVKVQGLTDAALISLVERHTCLERIHLSYCDRLTVPGVYYAVLKLSKLTHLSLTGVPAFRKKELQRMCRAPPPEFNDHQRATFCVYSGRGVHALRDYLSVLYLVWRRMLHPTHAPLTHHQPGSPISSSNPDLYIEAAAACHAVHIPLPQDAEGAEDAYVRAAQAAAVTLGIDHMPVPASYARARGSPPLPAVPAARTPAAQPDAGAGAGAGGAGAAPDPDPRTMDLIIATFHPPGSGPDATATDLRALSRPAALAHVSAPTAAQASATDTGASIATGTGTGAGTGQGTGPGDAARRALAVSMDAFLRLSIRLEHDHDHDAPASEPPEHAHVQAQDGNTEHDLNLGPDDTIDGGGDDDDNDDELRLGQSGRTHAYAHAHAPAQVHAHIPAADHATAAVHDTRHAHARAVARVALARRFLGIDPSPFGGGGAAAVIPDDTGTAGTDAHVHELAAGAWTEVPALEGSTLRHIWLPPGRVQAAQTSASAPTPAAPPVPRALVHRDVNQELGDGQGRQPSQPHPYLPSARPLSYVPAPLFAAAADSLARRSPFDPHIRLAQPQPDSRPQPNAAQLHRALQYNHDGARGPARLAASARSEAYARGHGHNALEWTAPPASTLPPPPPSQSRAAQWALDPQLVARLDRMLGGEHPLPHPR